MSPLLDVLPCLCRGVGPALLQGPLSRFGETAANAGTLSLLDSYDSLKNLPIGLKTVAASFSAGAFRIFLMPVDACKTTMQVSWPKCSQSCMHACNSTMPVSLPQYDAMLHA